jgi:hypothetical protein
VRIDLLLLPELKNATVDGIFSPQYKFSGTKEEGVCREGRAMLLG